MLFTMDTQASALYIKIKDGKVHDTKEVLPEVFVDYNTKGDVIGIDVVSPCVSIIRKVARKLHLPITKHLRKLKGLCRM